MLIVEKGFAPPVIPTSPPRWSCVVALAPHGGLGLSTTSTDSSGRSDYRAIVPGEDTLCREWRRRDHRQRTLIGALVPIGYLVGRAFGVADIRRPTAA